MDSHEIDLMDAKVFARGIPHEYFRALRQRAGLARAADSTGEDYWYIVRHRDVAAVSRQPEVFSSSPSTMTSVRQESAGLPIISFLDAPAHTRVRHLASKGFAPARIAALEEPVRRIVDTILATVLADQEFDLAETVALQLPLEVLAELIGVPDLDRPKVIEWSRQTVNLGDPEYDKTTPETGGLAFQNIFEYFSGLVQQRVNEPGDDLFSTLLAARVKGEQLAPHEIAMLATTLMSAGSETTYCTVTGGVLALLEHPDQLELLRADRGLLDGAVDEILRWVTPVTHFARTAKVDTEVAGQRIAAGERVVMWYTSANRDEAVFDDPDRFDIRRKPNPHISFGGGGPHVCIGTGLAMLELRLLLDALVEHLPRLHVAGPIARTETNFMNSIKYLPVRLA